MDFYSAAKGLENSFGENNCFMNVVIQVLAHSSCFKERFSMVYFDHNCRNEFCLSCELRSLLVDYEYSDRFTLSPEKLRKSISLNLGCFEEGKKACPVELIEKILDCLHGVSKVCPSHCAAHLSFGFETCEEIHCDCQRRFGETLSDTVIRTYASELFEMSQKNPEAGLDFLIGQSIINRASIDPCQECGTMKVVKKIIIQKPRVLLVSVTWAGGDPAVISWLAESISPVFLLRNIFSVSSERQDYFSRYILKGFVCYSLSHYVSFFYSLRRNAWVQFDDSKVCVIEDWSQVMSKIVSGKMQLVLIVFELDEQVDKNKREFQLKYIEDEVTNYLLSPDAYFESFCDTLFLDLAGLTWKSEIVDIKDTKKCGIF